MTIAIYTHADCLAHDPGAAHPENANRLRVTLNALRTSDLALAWLDAPVAEDEQLLLAHTPQYLDTIRASAPASGREFLDGDTAMSPGSLNAASRSAGAARQAVDDVLAGKYASAFCAVRPPGHHATRGRAMGFCIFNTIAIAALHAQRQGGARRVAIVDFDVHHGNGTQDIMTGKQDVLYISTHQSPLYPGTGNARENIPGNILNLPLPTGANGETYRPLFEEKILPELESFQPDLLLASAGFDAHIHDPLAGLALDEEDYRWIGQQLRRVAQKHCMGKVVATLEGGYNLEVLGASVVAFLTGLAAG